MKPSIESTQEVKGTSRIICVRAKDAIVAPSKIEPLKPPRRRRKTPLIDVTEEDWKWVNHGHGGFVIVCVDRRPKTQPNKNREANPTSEAEFLHQCKRAIVVAPRMPDSASDADELDENSRIVASSLCTVGEFADFANMPIQEVEDRIRWGMFIGLTIFGSRYVYLYEERDDITLNIRVSKEDYLKEFKAALIRLYKEMQVRWN